uniref:Uncharacterized protein n=1 Tax=Picea sitchensis TaxID=3332 RepID=A9NV25_PICSI|nr:unknown [Picea sitchensis]
MLGALQTLQNVQRQPFRFWVLRRLFSGLLKHVETHQSMVLFFIHLLLGELLLEIRGVYLVTWLTNVL